MKIIRNKFIPFKGFKAINLFGVMFVRGNAPIGDKTIRHESIHTEQMREMLYVPFYVWYITEWAIRSVAWGFGKKQNDSPYYRMGFEKEAYANEHDKEYLKNRKPYAWLKYL